MPSVEALRSVALFSQLRESDLARLGTVMRQQDFPKNRVILFAHDPCDAFYVLLAGQVKVMLVAEDGREVILSLILRGDFFGERTLLDEEPHAASVIAMEDSRLLILHRDEFRRCIMEMPGVAFGLLRALLGRLRDADHKIGGLILLDVTGRVCHLLLQLADWGDGKCIATPPTHQVIAQMVGSSRETVSRTIKTMTDQGFIDVSDGGITILDRRALENPAGQLLRRKVVDTPRRERRSAPTLGPALP
ncbi:MAG TPA: Crp/Fnr family transcriptional regulator [Gemmatimonadales bacterium]